MKQLFAILIFFQPFIVPAQDSVTKQKPYYVVKANVGVAPHGYVPIAILPAIERRINNYGFQLQTGSMISYKYTIQDTLDNITIKGNAQWYTIRLEARKYKILREKKLLPGKREGYVGLELFGNFSRQPIKDEYGNEAAEPYGKVYQDALILTKKMIGAGLTFGFYRYVGTRFCIGLNSGIGVKLKYTTAKYKYDKYDEITYRHGMFIRYADKVDYTIAMAMPLSITMAYSFN